MSEKTTEDCNGKPSGNTMAPKHHRWIEFVGKICGPEGCGYRRHPDGDLTWQCDGGDSMRAAERILTDMGGIDVAASVAHFRAHGARCDCEIAFNVERGGGMKHEERRRRRRAYCAEMGPMLTGTYVRGQPADAEQLLAAFHLLTDHGLSIYACVDGCFDILDGSTMLEYAYDEEGMRYWP